MTAPRDPVEVEPTLDPGAQNTPARPAKADADTPSQPGAADATLEVPVAPAAPVIAPPDSTGATLPTGSHRVPPSAAPPPPIAAKSIETKDGIEATLLPSSTGASAPLHGDSGPVIVLLPDATGTGASDGATLPLTADSVTSSGASSGPLGSDTNPMSHASSASGAKTGASPSATGTMVGRFALQDLHASGGLGEVFKARDTELNREVAVKRIKSRYADDPGSRRRFLTEAQLTAKLDHPGVVPVFGLVNDVRGRPCYAMRFIRGETLKDEIDRYYGNQRTGDRGQKTDKTDKAEEKKAEAPGFAPTPEESETDVPRSVAFRHLLARFIATCQAIAYAHSRGIIHRDIKPANVMVGTFGETLVVDWGLAKSLDDGPDFDRVMKAAAAAGFRRDPEATDLPSHMTLAGTAVGTPSYMAPEQATGELEKVGPRADVYALGATLYVILTGRAPFSGKTTNEVLEQVRRGAYESAASVNPECPKPLDAIARKAMALRQEDRYTTASELAADVERWLSDEPVSCYQDPLFERLARWARRNPARVATAVSLLLAGVLAAAGIAYAIHLGEKQTREEQKKTAAALDQVKEEMSKTDAAMQEVTKRNTQIETQNMLIEGQNVKLASARTAVTRRYEKAVAAYNVLINDLDKKLADRAGMQDLRKTLLLNATDGLKSLVAGEGKGSADRTLVAAYRQMGEVYQLIGETAKARENFQSAVDTAREVREEAQKGTDVPTKRAADRDLGRSLNKLSGIYVDSGDTKTALDKIDEAIRYLAPLAEDKTDAAAQKDLAAAQDTRAKILALLGKTGRAIKDAEDALAIRKSLFELDRTDAERKDAHAASLDALAELQMRTGRTREALASAEDALRLRKELAAQLPDRTDLARELAAAHARLGDVNFERGHLTAARQSYRDGADALKKLSDQDPKSVSAKADLAALYGRLAQVQLRTGDIAEAVDNSAEGRRLALELQKADPDSAKARRDLALARETYGDALLAVGRIDDGIVEYAESKATARRLCSADAESARAKLDLARALERLGDGCMAKKDAAGAVLSYGESVEFRREAVQKDAESARARRDLAVGLYKFADAHCAAGRPRTAEAPAVEATDLFVKLATDDPESAQTQRDIALAYGKWGQILATSGRATGALIVWQSSLERCETLAKVDTANVQAKEDEAAAWERLAGFYAALGNTDRALASARTAVVIWTTLGDEAAKSKAGRRRIALARIRCGDINVEIRKFAEARDWYKKAAADAKEPGDPLLEKVAKQVSEHQEYLDAVESVLANPANAKDVPERVRSAALKTAANLELRADHPTNAGAIATHLAKGAKNPDDAFAAAGVLAGCASATRGTEKAKDEYAADAVAQLKRAIEIGFRDADALAAPEWSAVRKRAKDFAKVQAELEKLKEGK